MHLKLTLFELALAGLLLASACGGSDSPTTTPVGAPATSSAAGGETASASPSTSAAPSPSAAATTGSPTSATSGDTTKAAPTHLGSPTGVAVTQAAPDFEALPGAKAIFGKLGNSVYRIEMPDSWNGDLVLWAHGFNGFGTEVSVQGPPNALRSQWVTSGYAWAASSFSENGYSPGIGADDTLALKQYFEQQYGKAKHTYIVGSSMGGNVVSLSLEAPGDTAVLSAADQRRIAALPGVRRAEFQREDLLQFAPGKPRVALLARTIDPERPAQSLPFVQPPIEVPSDAPPPVWVSEAMVDLHGLVPGMVVALPIAGENRRFTVAGVWRDYSRPQGTVVIERSRYIALSGDDAATNAALWLDAGSSVAVLSASLAAALPGGEGLEVGSPGDIRRVSLSIFDRTFVVTYALQLAAMVIGLIGLSSSFAALVVARRREFGVLRHLGMTRGEIRSMLATEGALVSTVGIVIGLLLGGVISFILIHVVNRQSFHWGMEVSIPWALLALMSAIVLCLSTLTAIVAGRQALAGDAVRAVREDW